MNKRLKSKLDRLTLEIIYLRDKGKCVRCGRYIHRMFAHKHHIIKVSQSKFLRWDVRNMILMDFDCHINWWHRNEKDGYKWFSKKYPKRWDYLQDNRQRIARFRDYDLKIILAENKEIMSKLKEKLGINSVQTPPLSGERDKMVN